MKDIFRNATFFCDGVSDLTTHVEQFVAKMARQNFSCKNWQIVQQEKITGKNLIKYEVIFNFVR